MMEGHSKTLCLGISEGKMQVAKEGQSSKEEKAIDGAWGI